MEDKLIKDLIYGRITKKEYNNLMKVKHLHVGTRVMAYGGNSNKLAKGTIKIFEDGNYMGVEFDGKISGGHDLNGKCKQGHGWYVDANDIVEVLHEEGEERGV